VLPRLLGGDQRHLLAAVQAPGLDARQYLRRRDRQRCGDLHRELVALHPLVLVVVDPADARAPRQHGVPGRCDVPTERGRRAEPGDDDLDLRRHWFLEM
jgi:hypothetical protein